MIRKAVIPIAGLGTRLGPIGAAVPKALLPLVGADGRVRPVAHWICAELASAGVESMALVHSPSQGEAVRRYFDAARAAGAGDLPPNIEWIAQDAPRGFGDAVLRARNFAAGEPVLVVLGDHIRLPALPGKACAAQVVEAFARHGGAAMVGMQVVDESELSLVGAAAGEPVAPRVYRCTCLIEKPDVETARRRLVTPGLSEGTYLAHAGLYAFTSEIFDCLESLAAEGRGTGGELQLSDAQSMLLERRPRDYYLLHVAGRVLDVGTAGGYASAVAELAGR